MNEEGEYVRKTQCPFCKYKDNSPKCMQQDKGKCKAPEVIKKFEEERKKDKTSSHYTGATK